MVSFIIPPCFLRNVTKVFPLLSRMTPPGTFSVDYHSTGPQCLVQLSATLGAHSGWLGTLRDLWDPDSLTPKVMALNIYFSPATVPYFYPWSGVHFYFLVCYVSVSFYVVSAFPLHVMLARLFDWQLSSTRVLTIAAKLHHFRSPRAKRRCSSSWRNKKVWHFWNFSRRNFFFLGVLFSLIKNLMGVRAMCCAVYNNSRVFTSPKPAVLAD